MINKLQHGVPSTWTNFYVKLNTNQASPLQSMSILVWTDNKWPKNKLDIWSYENKRESPHDKNYIYLIETSVANLEKEKTDKLTFFTKKLTKTDIFQHKIKNWHLKKKTDKNWQGMNPDLGAYTLINGTFSQFHENKFWRI